jgi:hypothetical protein
MKSVNHAAQGLLMSVPGRIAKGYRLFFYAERFKESAESVFILLRIRKGV